MAESIRKRINLKGILQGIGCRPTVFRLAKGHGLAGWVINTPDGVIIEVEGPMERLGLFLEQLPGAIPFPGRIDQSKEYEIQSLGEKEFTIRSSEKGPRETTPIPPDVAVCQECVQELFDPENHRYLYPFITCTLCGPRFTVVRSFPYDRERTSMADFTMCPECVKEYETPEDRRFHSQTNSCPKCGPSVWLTDSIGVGAPGDPIIETIKHLQNGMVIAIKGIGGFHLACDATNQVAVQKLRDRKGRIGKPFALMAPNMEVVNKYCLVDEDEAELLKSPIAPIVLLKERSRILPENVAPLVGTLGVMLPYSPIHHLLFNHPDINPSERLELLVMTSGNRSEEPIARDNSEAQERLGDLADFFLLHNRDITLRADDSIFRIIHGNKTVFRRSRGLVPGEFQLCEPHLDKSQGDHTNAEKVVLAAGGDLKNCMVILKGNRAIPGPHVGDLAAPVAQEYFEKSIETLQDYLEVKPDIVAVDPHPEYFSSRIAGSLADEIVQTYHHHAHAVSLMVEHGITGPIVCATFDGTGFGEDDSIWGGEFLIADIRRYKRAAFVAPYHLPGAEAAIKFPLRILAGLLAEQETWELDKKYSSLFAGSATDVPMWLEAAKKGFNSPVTTSAGRLFDAAAAAIGFNTPVTFEGAASMWLEAIADSSEKSIYPLDEIVDDTNFLEPRVLIRKVSHDILSGEVKGTVAARFHNTLAKAVSLTLQRLAREYETNVVGLSGGCFQNRLFTEITARDLEQAGYTPLLHGACPPNDGGIALGQAVIARATWKPDLTT